MGRRKNVDIRERFGFAVKARREEIGLTQEDLAEKAGIHRTYLSDVERGGRNLSLVNIERLAAAGITGGCSTSPPQYCPEASVTRAEMAVFLLRGIHGAGYSPPAVGSSTGFGDVPTTYWAAAWIKQLAAEGITTGCGNGNYCPESPVTRAEMAVFLLRSEHGSSHTPPAVGSSTGPATRAPVRRTVSTISFTERSRRR